MKTLISLLFTIVVSQTAYANNSQNLFDCMNKNTFAIEGQCIESMIEQNTDFVQVELEIKQQNEWLGGNELATLRFYPNLQLIEVIATLDVKSTGQELQ